MKYMELAVQKAIEGKNEGNVPVGCVIVKKGKVLCACNNKKNTSNIGVYHAEILAIIEACKKNKSWYLDDCDMYVTLKPCAMCLAAIAECRIKRVYYLLDSKYAENLNKNISNVKLKRISCDNNYEKILSCFFEELRIK